MTSRGPTVIVSFATGEGLEAGKTRVKKPYGKPCAAYRLVNKAKR